MDMHRQSVNTHEKKSIQFEEEKKMKRKNENLIRSYSEPPQNDELIFFLEETLLNFLCTFFVEKKNMFFFPNFPRIFVFLAHKNSTPNIQKLHAKIMKISISGFTPISDGTTFSI